MAWENFKVEQQRLQLINGVHCRRSLNDGFMH